MDHPPVAELLARAAAGDQRAWDAIVARFARLVWAVTRAHRLDRTRAEDVCQVVWLRLVENLDRIRDPERLSAWLVTTARRESLTAIRRANREAAGVSIDDLDLEAPDPEPISALVLSERDTVLRAAFDQLPDRCQMLLRLLTADPPAPYAQVVEIMGMPQGSIGPTRERCLKRLRDALSRLGIGTAEQA